MQLKHSRSAGWWVRLRFEGRGWWFGGCCGLSIKLLQKRVAISQGPQVPLGGLQIRNWKTRQIQPQYLWGRSPTYISNTKGKSPAPRLSTTSRGVPIPALGCCILFPHFWRNADFHANEVDWLGRMCRVATSVLPRRHFSSNSIFTVNVNCSELH